MPKQKKLNVPLIKGVVMFWMCLFFSVVSGVTGIGMQIATAPMLVFLLGFAAEKAASTAILIAFLSSVVAILGSSRAGFGAPASAAFLIFLGATIGAVFTVKASKSESVGRIRSIFQTGAWMLALFTVYTSTKSVLGPPELTIPFLRSGAGIVLIGLVCGALSQLFVIPSAVLIVPSLLFLTGRTPNESILTSLIVIAIASLLPAIGGLSRLSGSSRIGGWIVMGAAVGGGLGGWLLGALQRSNSVAPIVLHAITGMLLISHTMLQSRGRSQEEKS